MVAGTIQATDNNKSNITTYGEQALQGLDFTPEQASLIYNGANILIGVTGGLASLRAGTQVKFTLGGQSYNAIANGKGQLAISKANSSATNIQPLDNFTSSATNTILNPPSFTISNSQWGTKSAKHMRDFNLNVSNEVHRQKFREMIENIGRNPDRVVIGTFSGGGQKDVVMFCSLCKVMML